MILSDEQRQVAQDWLRLHDEYFHAHWFSANERKVAGQKLMVTGGTVLQAFDWTEITVEEMHFRLTEALGPAAGEDKR
jgi:hypothetical protein